jgi:nucleotide-binding universal stress UspA family protein
MGIVVGVDGSEESIRALRWALAEARLRGRTVQAVHAWQFPDVGEWGDDPYLQGPSYDLSMIVPDVMRKAAEARLADAMGEVDTAGVDVEQKVIEGHAAEALLHVAENENAELLVVGSRGHGGFAGVLLGSVSQACAHHASCPVVIVRGPASS